MKNCICENLCILSTLHDAEGGSLTFRQVNAETDSAFPAVLTKYKWKILTELPDGTDSYGITYLSYISTDFL